ncbi:homoprotocatechuate degradation operon regulator HpaR [Rhizobium sp. FY34]|uniref:homoprotocatechuate degradation operon regulator HpaR n=1 Tax=Rhizobium sp. FY34 TaxID=2562309 RepID=UPI0010C08B93|nr:homoprotocatechuate degradation operon regulator HpaR [Rhizobium sp. FY34]
MADGAVNGDGENKAADGMTAPRATRRSLPITLLRAREAVMSHFRPMLAEHDVTEQQWRVIRVLHEAGTLDASEVAERAFILAPSLTRMIRSLEERGFISKHKDISDGRRVLLAIAPAGEAIIREVLPDSRKIYQELETRFGRERIDLLVDMLDELASYRNEGARTVADE